MAADCLHRSEQPRLRVGDACFHIQAAIQHTSPVYVGITALYWFNDRANKTCFEILNRMDGMYGQKNKKTSEIIIEKLFIYLLTIYLLLLISYLFIYLFILFIYLFIYLFSKGSCLFSSMSLIWVLFNTNLMDRED